MKNEDKSERLSDALGDLPQDMIRESGSYTPALTRRANRIRALSVILAAVILLSAIPLGLFLFRKPEFPIPEPIAFSDGFFSGTGADVPEELSSVRIRAEGTDSRVISADACFLVETAGETDPVTLASYLSISPDVPASVTQLSATSFKVSPASGRLAPGQIYRLTIGDPDNPVASYAFQTENELIVSSVFPGQRGLNVPVDTGIEVCFSDSVRFRADDPPFEISPSVKGSYSLCPDGRTVVFVPQKPLAFDTVYTIRVKAGTASLSGKTLAEDYESCFRTATDGFQVGSSSGTDWVQLYLTAYDLVYSPGTPMPIRATFHTHLFGVQSDSLLTCDLYAYRTAEDAASVNARTG
ncbi:MAG: Ig-like domain-containing protein [Clostridia bacterium]|nr:Ig-like domain-containing protein [Clostridia bacterium]